MAKKKRYEFRPDKVDHDILGKLLLTKKQFHSLLRWLLYSIVCLAGLILQDVVMNRFKIFGATTDLVPVMIFMICLLQGAESSCIFTLSAAVIYHFSGSAPGVYCIPLLVFLGILASIVRQAYLQKGFSALILCSSLALLLYEAGIFAIALFLKLTMANRYPVFLITALISLICVPLLYPILSSIGKIGGETWKE